MKIMNRGISWFLALVMVLSLIPAVPSHVHASVIEQVDVTVPGRLEDLELAPVQPESVDQCCNTRRPETYRPDYYRPDFEGNLIEITPQRVEDTFQYLNEFYVEMHPEAALMCYTGTEEDRENLKLLAEIITEGCQTDKEKADAIDRWLMRNIYYDVNTSAYASDTFYRREGNCLSFANLMQFLLRSLGIPAVVGDGWRGDMKESTTSLFNMEGHAWCFVYLEGEWVLYDPLWIECGTTDREYMAEWIYFDTVEFVVPASDPENLPPRLSEVPSVYYTDGKIYMYSNAFPLGAGTLSYFVNNQAYVFVSNQCDENSSDGRYYYDESKDKTLMEQGEVYRDGWVSYGDYRMGKSMAHTYAFPNGMMPDGYTLDFDGIRWYMSYDSAVPILMDEDDYHIQDGLVTLRPGYTGQFLGLRYQDGCLESSIGEVFLTYTNETPEVATIDDDGNITCHDEGYAEFRIYLKRRERNGNETLMGSSLMSVFVSNEDRTPDFTDHQPHEHSFDSSYYVEANCENPGYIVLVCACGEEEWCYYEDPLGHDHSIIQVTDATCTTGGYTTRICSRCGYSYTEDPVDALGHELGDWYEVKPATTEETGLKRADCIRCDYHEEQEIPMLEHPFADVTDDAYFHDPIVWAIKAGITNGTTATTFDPETTCTREQIVTFLWRAAGKPEPNATEHPFEDVTEASYAYKAILWAVENGITTGTSATTFGLQDACTREQVATFIWRAMGRPEPATTENPFTDVSEGNFGYEPILWAVENHITSGYGNGLFGTNDICTRGQIVTFLYRAFAEQ